MRIGFVGDSTIAEIQSARRFRLSSYSSEKFRETALLNLDGVQANIEYSAKNSLLNYRIRSEIIPFASHAVCDVDWKSEYAARFPVIGALVKKYEMRVSFHPDQFVVLNAPSEKVVQNSIAELQYQSTVLDLMQVGNEHKLQIHVGGAYGDKMESKKRFAATFQKLPDSIKRRLVIENDDRLYTVQDCLDIHTETGIPILFDNLHHAMNPDGRSLREAIEACFATWKNEDGLPMVDYSSQQPGMRAGKHADHIDIHQFEAYLQETTGLNFDIMLEIKDKDVSALEALQAAKKLRRI